MAKIITQTDLDWFMENAWEALGFLAYNSYLENGKGFVGIDMNTEEWQIMYVKIEEDSTFDKKIKDVVSQYDPKNEIVLHFASAENQFRTVRLRHPSKLSPEEVWLSVNSNKN